MIVPVVGYLPDEIVQWTVSGAATGAMGLAGWVARKRVTDRRAAKAEADAARKAALDAVAAARIEQDGWRDELRKDRDAAYERMDHLEAKQEATQRALDQALATLAVRTRQLDMYENELSVVRGENAVMKVQIGLLQAEMEKLRRQRGGRRGTDL